jgi:DNA-directed RNA polymerase subunit RPC12/RpoP
MNNPDKRMHLRCSDCKTDFSTEPVFPMDVRKLNKLVRETKCPNCGSGSKRLHMRLNVNMEQGKK